MEWGSLSGSRHARRAEFDHPKAPQMKVKKCNKAREETLWHQ